MADRATVGSRRLVRMDTMRFPDPDGGVTVACAEQHHDFCHGRRTIDGEPFGPCTCPCHMTPEERAAERPPWCDAGDQVITQWEQFTTAKDALSQASALLCLADAIADLRSWLPNEAEERYG